MLNTIQDTQWYTQHQTKGVWKFRNLTVIFLTRYLKSLHIINGFSLCEKTFNIYKVLFSNIRIAFLLLQAIGFPVLDLLLHPSAILGTPLLHKLIYILLKFWRENYRISTNQRDMRVCNGEVKQRPLRKRFILNLPHRLLIRFDEDVGVLLSISISEPESSSANVIITSR